MNINNITVRANYSKLTIRIFVVYEDGYKVKYLINCKDNEEFEERLNFGKIDWEEFLKYGEYKEA